MEDAVMPAGIALPAMPTRNAQTINWVNEVEQLMSNAGIAVGPPEPAKPFTTAGSCCRLEARPQIGIICYLLRTGCAFSVFPCGSNDFPQFAAMTAPLRPYRKPAPSRPRQDSTHSEISAPSHGFGASVANPVSRRCPACGFAVALLLPQTLAAGGPPASAAPAPAPTAAPWTVATSAAVKTGYDSNVMLQDDGDQARRAAWVNSLAATFAATYAPNPLFKAMFSYAPEFTFYEGQTTENHLTHRGLLNLSGSGDDLTWELLNSVTRIDGDDLGPIYTLDGGTRPAELPAVGGVPVRDRRDAAIFKNSFKLTKTWDQLFVRPVATFYHHNFMTEQHAPVGPYLGYENYIDRQELNGGIDLGYEAWSKTWLVAGVRVGQQKQYERLGVPSPYDNHYYRILAGIEGTPLDWLKLNVIAGPDFRDFDGTTPAGFDPDQLYYFVDATATITPT
jgi:hypothetical protein